MIIYIVIIFLLISFNFLNLFFLIYSIFIIQIKFPFLFIFNLQYKKNNFLNNAQFLNAQKKKKKKSSEQNRLILVSIKKFLIYAKKIYKDFQVCHFRYLFGNFYMCVSSIYQVPLKKKVAFKLLLRFQHT